LLYNPLIGDLGRLGKKCAGLVYLPLVFQEYIMIINKFSFCSQEGKP